MRSTTFALRAAHVFVVAACVLARASFAQESGAAVRDVERAARAAELRAQLAQPADPDDTREDDRRIARAAFAIAEEGLRELAPDVQTALAACAQRLGDTDARSACRGLLDALVVLGERVPASVLAQTQYTAREAALILAARDPASHVERLAGLSDGLRPRDAAVVASLLFRVDPHRAVACVLRRAELRVVLAVRDQVDDESETRHRGEKRWRAPNDGVPFAEYTFVRLPDDDAMAFESGPIALGWIRTTVAPGDDVPFADEGPAELVELANVLLGETSGMRPLVTRRVFPVTPATLADGVRRAQRELAEQRATWDAFRRLAHARGWTSFAQSDVAAPLGFGRLDERKDVSVPLPDVDDDIDRWIAACADDPANRLVPFDDAARAELRADLASGVAERVAWAASAIASLRAPEFATELRAALARVDPVAQELGPRFVAHALFDALIQTRTALSAGEFERWRDHDMTAQLLALAALDPSGALAFLEASIDRSRDSGLPRLDWVASCNLFAHAAPSRFAALVLGERSLELVLRVRDPDDDFAHPTLARYSIGCGPGRPTPVTFPRIVEYELELLGAGTPGALADGPIPIGVRRRAGEMFGGGCNSRYGCHEQRYRIELLRALVGMHDTATDLDVSCTWSDAAQFTRDAASVRARVTDGWARLVDAARDRGLVTSAFAASVRSVDLHGRVVDRRRDRETPLPELDVK